MRSFTTLTTLLLAAIATSAAAVTPLPEVAVTSCGQIVPKRTLGYLTGDLDCSGYTGDGPDLYDAGAAVTLGYKSKLDLRGFTHVRLVASGGIDEYQIPALNSVVDSYGIGTSLANAPVLNFALDIMEIEGKPMAKRGKWSGAKDVYRCRSCRASLVVPAGRVPDACSCGGAWESLLKPLVRGGRIVRDLPPPRTIREHVLDQLTGVATLSMRRFGVPPRNGNRHNSGACSGCCRRKSINAPCGSKLAPNRRTSGSGFTICTLLGRIYDRLRSEFGADAIFKDVDARTT